MSAITAALLAELSDAELARLAERLRPYLNRSDQDQLLTPADAAARLGLHPKTLTRAAASGRVVGAVRVGRAWRFRADGLLLEPPAGISPATATLARPRSAGKGTADAIANAGPSRADV